MGLRTRLVALLAIFVAIGLITSTGAFTTASAERTIDVNVAKDSNALLQIEPHSGPNGAYAEESNGQLQINFDGVSAGGVNLNAQTTLGDVFNITNQGTQTAAVNITKTGANSGLVTFETADGTRLDSNSGASLAVGDTIEVTIEIDTTGQSLAANDELLSSITIHAEG